MAKLVKDIPDRRPAEAGDLVEKLLPDGDAGMAVLRERARLLEQQAAQLRVLAREVHHQRTLKELAAPSPARRTTSIWHGRPC